MKRRDNNKAPSSDPHRLLFGSNVPEQAGGYTSIFCARGLINHDTTYLSYLTCDGGVNTLHPGDDQTFY